MRGWALGLAAVLLWQGAVGAQSLPIHGYFQGESAYRLIQPDRCPQTQRSACQEEFVRGGERLQLEFAPRGEWWGFLGKTEIIHDAVSGSAEVDLREGYLDFRFPALDVRLGRQIITWGVGDLIFITDMFPKNRVAFISGLPLEYLKKGSDAVNVTSHWAGTSLQVVLIPHFEADTLPEAGGRLSVRSEGGDWRETHGRASPGHRERRNRAQDFPECWWVGHLALCVSGFLPRPLGGDGSGPAASLFLSGP